MDTILPNILDELLDAKGSMIGRNKAAIELKNFDMLEAEEALLTVARNQSEYTLVVRSCGESLAEIWLRKNSFQIEKLEGLRSTALDRINSSFKEKNAYWVQELEDRFNGFLFSKPWKRVEIKHTDELLERLHLALPDGHNLKGPSLLPIAERIDNSIFLCTNKDDKYYVIHLDRHKISRSMPKGILIEEYECMKDFYINRFLPDSEDYNYQ